MAASDYSSNSDIRQLGTILLIDDDDTTNFINKRLLDKLEIAEEVVSVRNGKEALAYLNQACAIAAEDAPACPDLIFLDIKMPVMDGFEFLEEYERLEIGKKNPDIVLLMLSSSASFYDLERLKQYKSVRKHYTKALSKYDVRDILGEFFPRQ